VRCHESRCSLATFNTVKSFPLENYRLEWCGNGSNNIDREDAASYILVSKQEICSCFPTGTDQTSEVGQHQDHYPFIASPEDECCALSPHGDFLMASPDESVNPESPESPPFVMPSNFQTTNQVLFGARSNQQSNTGRPIILLYSRLCGMC
jgi:hypothetical protein